MSIRFACSPPGRSLVRHLFRAPTRTQARAFVAAVFLAATGADAQSGPPAPDGASATLPRDQLRAAFEEVNGHIAKSAELVDEARYGYQPIGTVRTLGQLLGHIVDGYHFYCGRAAGRNVQWSDSTAQGAHGKAALVVRLRDAAARCSSAYASGNVGPLLMNTFHANLHYGNLITYLRLLGLVPPSSG